MKRTRAIVLAGVLALPAAEASAQEAGDYLFQQKCAVCHRESQVLRRMRSLSPQERNERLERFLPGHYAPNPQERQLIIDFLGTLVRG